MKSPSFTLVMVISILANMVGPVLAPAQAIAAPAPVPSPAGVLPAWFAPAPSAANDMDATLPSWFTAADAESRPAVAHPATCPLPAASKPSSALPDWFLPAARLPESNRPAPPPAPQSRRLERAIPLSLLTVYVFGPDVASLGAPLGSGEVYTAVIRNDSSQIAYGVYLTATHPLFFIHDGGDQLFSSSGAITISTTLGAGAITWTPVPTYNLAPGEAITLNFKLRAACWAESGKRLEVGVRYNADPPPAAPIELNTGAINVTTGRGNLVIKKEPALQNLGTPDFGEPITWTITVQNTGLGVLYGAVITDDGGVDLAAPSLTPPTRTIPRLGINESVVYTAVGTVEACNFTNVAQASWPCGNKVGDATITNPLESTVSVLFTPELPNVSLQAASPITFSYCAAVTRTVVITVDNAGGPAGNFRLDSTLESDGFLQIVNGSVGGDWQYSGGVFSYTGGSPAGTLPAAGMGVPLTLTFQVQPASDYVCSAGSGAIAFTPLYNGLCSGDPFTGNPVSVDYQYAESTEPTLDIVKDGPTIVSGGDVFTYQVTVSGANADHISGTVNVTDVLPSQFELLGIISTTTGVTNTNGQTVTWNFDPGSAASFAESIIYQVRAITTANGVCGASLIVHNGAQAAAHPTCPGCSLLTDQAQIDTAIQNNEGIFPANSASGVYEACGDGFNIVNHYLITGSAVITWAGAVFTEALGTDIGGAGALTTSVPLIYRAGSLSVTVNGVDYTAVVTPVTSTGHLVINLTPLQAAGAPTQNVTLAITYTVEISEGSLDGLVERTFHDWTQLFLPDFSDTEGCAGNNSFNQVLVLTIGRGDLGVGLSPQILDKCRTNRAIIHVDDNTPGRLTDHVVVTFTSSSAEIASARNFTATGGLPAISSITIVTDADIGGGRGIITFTFPTGSDPGDGTIEFDLDVNCTDEAPWEAGITFQSRCGFAHGHHTALTHIYNKPNLLLFATPVKYTVREKDVMWKFFVTNNGNLTATDVLVTNTLAGLAVFTYSADGPDISANVPVTNGALVFTVPQIAPNQQRAVTVTARTIACDPLGVVISATHRCFGTVCNNPSAQIEFDTPDPYLLTNNGETADLPMCDVGEVIFTTKNASSDVTLYTLDITETLHQLRPAPGEPITVTIEDPEGHTVAQTSSFTPTTVYSGAETTLLIWKAISATNTAVYTWFDALPPMYVVRIFVPVRTSCVPPNAPQSFAQAGALGPCGKKLGYTEDAVTLQTLDPDMTLLKQGRVAGGDWGKTVYASPGQTVTWRLEVDNRDSSNSYVAQNVVLSDTWPVYFQFITATLGYTPTISAAARTITWAIGDMEPQDAPLYFLITGTVVLTDDACSGATANRSELTYGCDNDGCTSAIVPQDSADLDSGPNLAAELNPGPLPICGGDIPITIRNYGATAFSNVLTITLPAAYVYSETVSAGLTPDWVITTNPSAPVFGWDEIPGRTTANPYQFTLIIAVRSSNAAGACPNAGGAPVTATLGYDSHAICTHSGPFSTSASTTLAVLSPNLVVDKSPHAQTVDAGERVTWTITVDNTGNGVAENVVVTDVAGNNYTALTATLGSDGAVPTVTGNQAVWVLPSTIPASGSWTAQISALLLDVGENRNVVTATSVCASGCSTAVTTDTAYTTLLQEFAKNPQIQTGTVGSLVVFTFTTFLSDRDTVYEELTITDTLPAGLGYVSSYLTATYDGDGNQGGTGILSTSSPITPGGAYPSGPVVWALGDLSGTVSINGVITAVIQDDPAAYDGARLVNDLRMTYTDDNQPYVYTDTADVDVLLPVLHIGKSYVTPSGCGATLLQDNFNDGDASGWTGSPNWSVVDGVYRTTNDYSARYRGDTAWTDYSFSAMMRAGDDNAGMGLRFRYQDGDNYYWFYWQSSRMRLRRRAAETTITVVDLNGANYGYEPGQWYHVEVRAEANHIRIYIDGLLWIDYYDPAANAPANGRVGLYSGAGSGVRMFDDILVTRLDGMACYVGANDLVTYTIPISNQSHLPGYNLVITDALPGGMNLVTYTMTSDDPASAVTAEPAPIPGATGDLVWNVNQLTATAPFSPLHHTALTLTVVLHVSDGITANITLPNQASLSYDNWPGETQPTTIDRDSSGGSHSTAVRTVDAGIAKTVQFSPPPTATLGTLVTYTLILPASPISATLYDAVVTDTIDPRLYIESIDTTPSGAGVSSNFDRASGLVTATFASIPHHTQALITVTTRISHEWPSAAGDANDGETITNTAVMTHTTADEITTANVVTTIVAEPVLTLTKFSTPPTSNTVGAGYVVTYTVLVTNAGWITSSPAYDIFITDTLPAYVTLFPPIPVSLEINGSPVAASDFVSSYVAGVLTLDLTDTISIPVGGVLTLIYHGRVDADVPAGVDLTNRAEVTWSSLAGDVPGDRDYGPISDTTTVHAGYPDLDLEKSAEPSPVEAGGYLTYTLTVTNTGIVSATGVFITDVIPLNTTFVTATLPHTGPDSSDVITWPLGTLGIGIPRTVTMVVQVDSPLFNGTLITNTAWVTSSEGLTDTDDITTPVESRHTLTLTKTGAPSPVQAGATLAYTLTWQVTGNEPAPDLTISDTVPTHTTYLGCGPTPCGEAGGVVTWNLGDHVPGDSGFVTLTVAVAQPLISGTLIYNAAIITDSTGISDTGDITIPVESAHTLAITKTAAPLPVQAGELLTYTLTWAVSGNEPAQGVTISDTVPAHTTFWAASPPTVTAPIVGGTGPVVWYLGDQNPPASGVVTMVVLVDSPLVSGTQIYNGALISDTQGITDTDDITTPVESAHTLAITKTAAPLPAQAGGLLTYTLAWEVSGNEPAPDVTISDTVPAHTTFWAASPPTVTAPGVGGTGPVVWYLGDQNPPASGVVTMVVLVDDPLITGTLIYNAAVITDSSGITDTDDIVTPVGSGHTLTLHKTADPPSVSAGETLAYTLAWAVSGTEPALGVTISDTVPANTTYLGCGPLPCGESGGVITWTLGDHVPGDSGFVTATVRVDSSTLSGTLIYNAAIITDTQGITDTDDVTTPVETLANLAIIKSDDPDPVIVGTRLTYTLAVTNYGPSDAQNVVVTDTLPPEVEFITATLPVTVSLPDLAWPLGTVAAGDGRLITVVVTVRQWVTQTFTNQAVVTTTTPEDTPEDNEDDEDTTPLVPGLAVEKLVAPGVAARSMPFTYALRIANTGQVTFTALRISDTLPADFHYVPGSGNPADPDTVAEPLLVWNDIIPSVGQLFPGRIVTVTFAVTATPGVTGTYWNHVTVTGTTPGGVITDTDDVPVDIRDPALRLSKDILSIDRDGTPPDYVTFTIAITNVGPTVIDVLPLVDQYDPYYLAFKEANPAPDGVTPGFLTWADLTVPLGNLSPGETFHVITVFTIAHEINLTTTNVATTSSAVDVYDNTADEDDDDEEIGGEEGGDDIPTPLEVIYFRAQAEETAVRLEWATAAELDLTGFHLYRASADDWNAAQPIAYAAATGPGSEYSYTDKDVTAGQVYWYWLVEEVSAGNPDTYGPVQGGVGIDQLPNHLYLPLILNNGQRLSRSGRSAPPALFVGPPAPVRVSAAAKPASPEPAVLRAGEDGVVIEWRAPVFTQHQVTGGDGRFYTALDTPGWTQADLPGQPRLPFASALLVAPPSGEVTLHVQALERGRVSLAHPVLPALEPAPAAGDSVAWTWARDDLAYSTEARSAQWVTLEEAGWMRGHRLVRVTFYPLRMTGTALEVARRVRVEVCFAGEETWFLGKNRVSHSSPDPFTPVLDNSVVNPAQAAQFALPERTVSAPDSALADPPGGADYLIIAPAAFTSAVAPLASHRQAEGLRVHSVTVEEIYATYGGAHQEAIKNYIAHAYTSWTPPALSYVLLVGDGTEDGSGPQYVPPYMIADPWGYEANGVAADNRYVTMDGPDDRVADIFIGRLPVNSAAEANTVVQKILDYETNPPQYPWNERVLFVAGHGDPAQGEQFHEHSDWLYGTLPAGVKGQRAYFCTADCARPYKYTDISTAHDAALNMLNGGGLIATYEGHSSWQQWDYDPVTFAPLFHVNDDVPDLHNGGALPMFVEATCYSSRFADPAGGTLDEELLRLAGGGAVAVWGNTTLGLDSGQNILRERFFYAVFDSGVTELGPAIGYAKAGLDSHNATLHDTFILLGDPAMNLDTTVIPWKNELYLPLVMRGG